MSTIVIGDVHGCLVELKMLLDKINYRPQVDKLLFTGDLINGGQDSLGTLRFIKSLPNVQCVLGNHDLALLALAMNTHQEHISKYMTPCYQSILNAKDSDELLTWLLQLPLVHYESQHNILLVHAGILPTWELSEVIDLSSSVKDILQSHNRQEFMTKMFIKDEIAWMANLNEYDKAIFVVNCLTRIRFCNANWQLEFNSKGDVESAPVGYKPWFAYNRKPLLDGAHKVRVIFGHWAALKGVTHRADIIALDTGCVWGHKLTALRLDDLMYFSVDSLQAKQF